MKSKITYPAFLKVGEEIDSETKKMKPVIINTGPYSKDRCGETQDDVNKYLAHLQDIYDNKNKINDLL